MEHHRSNSIRVGSTMYKPVALEQDASMIPRKKLLTMAHFYEGELVSVVRADGRKVIAQITAITAKWIILTCGRGVVMHIKAPDVEMRISKLVGAYYLADGGHVTQPPAMVDNDVKVGGTLITPVSLGQDATSLAKRNGFPAEYFYAGEPVASFEMGHNLLKVGQVISVDIASGLVVEFATGKTTSIPASHVPSMVGKLLGRFYLTSTPSLNSQRPPERTAAQISQNIDRFFLRHNNDVVQEVFRRHAVNGAPDESGKLALRKEQLPAALKELFVDVREDVLDERDLDLDGVIDLDEFRRAVLPPSHVEAWAKSLHLPRLLADALQPIPSETPQASLSAIGNLSEADIDVVSNGFCEGLRRLLRERVKLLRAAIGAKGEHEMRTRNFKFDVQKMENCGTIQDFHNGLVGRVVHETDVWSKIDAVRGSGSCHLDFYIAMEAEHCTKLGCDHEFTTQNYQITTTPKAEWNIVVHNTRTNCMTHGRKLLKIDELAKLELATKSNITRHELIAVVLYTGPMHHVYNSILRRFPLQDYNVFLKAKNLFSTTIAVIVSAVLKISRFGKLPEGLRLYRGLGGTVDLPESFVKRDSKGLKGFLEWGFMSTTANKEIAIGYSGIAQNKPLPLVLEIRVGAVDRGACIRDFSQYPTEVEYLFVPCSFLQPDEQEYLDVSEHGVVIVHPVKVNANLKAMTVEELLAHKKTMHIAAFNYLIHEIECKLNTIAAEQNAELRFGRDTSRDENTHSVKGFIARIVEQCWEVLARHEAISVEEYSSHVRFHSLSVEMVDVKTFAIAKLEEWLENESNSFIRFRWNAALRTVYRRWIGYLSRNFKTCDEGNKQKAAIRLCRYKKLMVNGVEEQNELGETRLMDVATERNSPKDLKLLVNAGATVNAKRPDGVTAMWLAAQFGRAKCIKRLHALKADVNQAANDGATPAYIAAQNGYVKCIQRLHDLKADVLRADKKGLTPLHQAAMNGQLDCIQALRKLNADLASVDDSGKSAIDHARANKHEKCVEYLAKWMEEITGSVPMTSAVHGDEVETGTRKLIISTGDISDVDGFFALAEYAKTGADVLFIMNYPAYIGVNEADDTHSDRNPGLGYKYGAAQVFQKVPVPQPESYVSFLSSYDGLEDNERMKRAMTDIAFSIAKRAWAEVPGNRGKLWFCIGGINAVNPFSAKAVKNEVLVYSNLISKPAKVLEAKEGTIYNEDSESCNFDWRQYADIYIDFNGSMAFWNESWLNTLSEKSVVGKIRGAFIMGGVYCDKPPCTLPSIPDILNRFSSATMNQLFHPQKAADFFAFLKQNRIEAYIITNNVVADLTTVSQTGTTVKTYDGVERFLSANDLDRPFLRDVAKAHYTSIYNPPRKPFDFYTALALKAKLSGERVKNTAKVLLYSNVYGITFVSNRDDWKDTRTQYSGVIDTEVDADDPEFVKTKKLNFRKEIEIVNSLTQVPSLPVLDVSFEMDDETKKLKVLLGSANS